MYPEKHTMKMLPLFKEWNSRQQAVKTIGKFILLLSSYVDAEPAETINRYDKKKTENECPNITPSGYPRVQPMENVFLQTLCVLIRCQGQEKIIRAVIDSGSQVVISQVGSESKVTLIRTKNRVALVKPLSIPRLELMACCIGARLVNSVIRALGVASIKVTLWSDSTVALW
ncbi:uncharacterized protein NPIL_200341 [Nephila pilipes]|uniref:Peptidase A2 domain-containing protein n=1 Tax=Nephila pilipes TaxID=299642 RepID=A0A8X6UDN6_NEPPI|nr:uncharacterized protein NPIL_200341 [Nephila pilipes]